MALANHHWNHYYHVKTTWKCENSLEITNPLTEITSHSEKKNENRKNNRREEKVDAKCTSYFHMCKTNWMERVSYFAQFVILICHVKMCTVLLRICNALRHSISMHFASIISGWITRLFLLIPFLLVFLCVAAAFVAICSSLFLTHPCSWLRWACSQKPIHYTDISILCCSIFGFTLVVCHSFDNNAHFYFSQVGF